jgi:hypothetical protein
MEKAGSAIRTWSIDCFRKGTFLLASSGFIMPLLSRIMRQMAAACSSVAAIISALALAPGNSLSSGASSASASTSAKGFHTAYNTLCRLSTIQHSNSGSSCRHENATRKPNATRSPSRVSRLPPCERTGHCRINDSAMAPRSPSRSELSGQSAARQLRRRLPPAVGPSMARRCRTRANVNKRSLKEQCCTRQFTHRYHAICDSQRAHSVSQSLCRPRSRFFL